METKNSKMFEKFFKDSFENYEVAYSPDEWSGFEKKFDKALKHKFFNKLKLTVGSIIIAAAVAIYFINTNNVINTNAINKTNSEKDLVNVNVPALTGNNIISENPESENNTAPVIVKNNTNKTLSSINNNTESYNAVNEKVIKNDVKDNKINTVKEIDRKNQDDNSVINENSNIQNLTIDVNKVVVCAEEEISFFPSIINQSFEYYWSFGDDNVSAKANPVHTFNNSGIYEVKLVVKDINKKLYNASVSITVNSKPETKFDYEIVQEGMAYPQVRFFDKSSEALNWEWKFGDEKISYEQNPLHVYFINADKKINVSLTTTNVFGCKSKVEKPIAFENIFDIMAPNAFSPDGDGLNDYFIPKALEIYDIPFEMFIYDRAGTLIFNSKTKSSPWDGRVAQTGLIPETGTFIWIVILKDNNGKDIKYAGTVSIIK